MRIAVAALLAVHGSLHLLGFVKAWGLAPVPQLSGRAIVSMSDGASRAVGMVWLATWLVFLGAAVLYVTRSASWWMIAATGVGLSQALIVLHWPDAKAGTVANVLLAVVVLVAGATSRFHDRVDAEVRAMYAATDARPAEIVGRHELAGVPAPVRRWLERTGIVGRERARTVRLRQRGEMHTASDAPWMPVSAEQYYTVDDPGFVWWMESTAMKVVPMCGRDKYVRGEGEMLIKIAGLVNVANERGGELSKAAMLRYLAEIVWFPSAALGRQLVWSPIDDTHATATMTNRGVTASALFTFDERGRPLAVSADRYSSDTGALERWGGRMTEWKVIRGVEIPVRGEVVWYLKAGELTFFRWEIVDVERNRPVVYGDEPASRAVPGEGESALSAIGAGADGRLSRRRWERLAPEDTTKQ